MLLQENKQLILQRDESDHSSKTVPPSEIRISLISSFKNFINGYLALRIALNERNTRNKLSLPLLKGKFWRGWGDKNILGQIIIVIICVPLVTNHSGKYFVHYGECFQYLPAK